MTAYTGPEATKIRDMFSTIADRYDRANTMLSAGIHHLWRRSLVRWSDVREGDQVLDCATGTGDLAIAFRKVVGSRGRVLGTDFCPEMLASAPQKAAPWGENIRFEMADVMALPYADANFDVSSISFGIRNVQNPVQGLSELARVVKAGGRVMILEFGQPNLPVFRELYDFYSKKVLPRLGGWVTGKPEAYEYLEKSAGKFPCREEFVALMKETNLFEKIEYRSLSGGIAYLYRGLRK